jgi:cation:H+ antiporter
MLLQTLLIIAGFALLIKGADIFIDGSCSIAKRFKVSDFVIGMTLVAFGTSAPEMAVSIISAINGNSGIALGNVLGSNMANICVILGIIAIIAPITIRKSIVWREIPFCLATAVALTIILSTNNTQFLVSRIEAIILLAGLGIYILFMLMPGQKEIIPEAEAHEHKLYISIILTIGGLIALVLGGNIVVTNSIKIAQEFGVSEAMIGLTIVALGTSLPELAASLAALKKGKPDIIIGNIVGSNILNTCLVLGSAAIIKPLTSTKSFILDTNIAMTATLLLFLFMFIGKKHQLNRWKGVLLIILYVGYMGYVIYRK